MTPDLSTSAKIDELTRIFLDGKLIDKYLSDPSVKMPTQTSRNFLKSTHQSSDTPFLAAGGGLGRLWTSITRATQKMEYGKYSPAHWRSYYLFPDSAARARAHDFYVRRSHDGMAFERYEERIINGSAEYAERWFNQILAQASALLKNDQPNISFVTGGIGAGKSTFIKYLLTTQCDLFNRYKVIPSRIEHAKLKRELQRLPPDDAHNGILSLNSFYDYFVLHVKRRLVRDFCLFAFGRPDAEGIYQYQSLTDEEKHDLQEELQLWFWDYVSPENQPVTIQNAVNSLASLMHVASRNRADAASRIANLPEEIVDIALFLADMRGYKFLPVFDGFDRIEGSDFIFSALNTRTLEVLAGWLFRDESKMTFTHLSSHATKMNSVVCLRRNTVPYFETMIKAYLAYPRTDYQFVVAPLANRIIEGVTRDIMRGYGSHEAVNEAEVRQLGDKCVRLHQVLLRECRSVGTANWLTRTDDVFNDNVRNHLHFLRDILRVALDEVRAKITDAKSSGIVDEFQSRLEQYVDGRAGYRVFTIYLCADNKLFTNFMAFDNENLKAMLDTNNYEMLFDGGSFSRRAVCVDNDKESGYVDNLFNYHFYLPSKQRWGEFLEKIRILQILTATNTPLNLKQITDKLADNFNYSSPCLGVSLAVLIRGGFVACYLDAPPSADRGLDQLSYVIEPLGELALQHLVYKSEYLETIYHQMLLPIGLSEVSDDVVRQVVEPGARLSGSPSDELNRWIMASIKHCFIVCNLIEHIENANPPMDVNTRLN